MGKHVNSFEEFRKLNEGLSTKDAKQTIKDIFDKFDGIVDDKYLKDMWKGNSTLRNLYGKDLFDKAWEELIDNGTIETEDGKEWCWCASKKKKEVVNESTEYVSTLMDKFGIDLTQAAKLDEIIDELLGMDDLDDRMDFVEGLDLYDITEDEDKEEEIMEYLKDMCIG